MLAALATIRKYENYSPGSTQILFICLPTGQVGSFTESRIRLTLFFSLRN